MKVVITRPKERSGYFAKLLEDNGFEPILIPTLELIYKTDVKIDVDNYGWILFTSPSGVKGLYNIIDDKEKEKVKNKKIGAIGIKTAKAFEKYFGKYPDVVPKEYTAERLLEELKKIINGNERFLIPTTPSTRDVLKNNLNVDLLFVYTSEEPKDIKEKLEKLKEIIKEENRKDKKIILTFTSGLTARNFFKNVDNELKELLKNQHIVAIGPITKKEINKFGFDALTPKEYTIEGMLEVIKNKLVKE
ncbi:uroporphyrinogen-III synthase [Methanotorris formicicus]|nr:uroporphyrinogen-III synthase [Methanotorris formicicus]